MNLRYLGAFGRLLQYTWQMLVILRISMRLSREGFGTIVTSSLVSLGWFLVKALVCRICLLAMTVLFMYGLQWVFRQLVLVGAVLCQHGYLQQCRAPPDDMASRFLAGKVSIQGTLVLLLWVMTLERIASL